MSELSCMKSIFHYHFIFGQNDINETWHRLRELRCKDIKQLWQRQLEVRRLLVIIEPQTKGFNDANWPLWEKKGSVNPKQFCEIFIVVVL